MSRNLWTWLVYDAANSFFTAAIGGMYLAQWVVLDNGFDDIWYGGTFTLATILLLLTSPFWGAWSDRIGKRMPFINWMTIILIVTGFLLAFTTISHYSPAFKVITALFLFFIIQYAYQLSLIFYNALIDQLSTSGTRGKISGLGGAFGGGGWILGIAILLPFATGKITLIGEPGRAQVFLPAVVLFALTAWPMLIWFKEKKLKVKEKRVDFRGVYNKTLQGFKDLIGRNRNVAVFLLAFCLISDGMRTAELYFAIFLDQIFKIPDTQKFMILALMYVFATPGAYFIGKIGDKYGMKKILILVCLVLILALSSVVSFSVVWVLYLFAVFGGLAWGGFYATARALLVKISPPLQLGEYFGFYATFERFASIIGPVVWGVITLMLKHYGVVKYRVAGFSLLFLMAIGTYLLTRVKERKVIA